ncbi:bifunctional acetate--CoA ligase family protein/GNAT family N-acetyltransferase [Verrucomicrobium sp. 3C]|uniref:bifunctional acetate--CoA ligase family protein/GNAT family N-acetyltransferase n=1 Tax=Verrucomicrobium sp. 3C TaxID=1134055 RepID=UPI000376B698|nr:bifunctional acetate--CoA ligase family protein/GNAT family N-acetyltransferase [Verrucomicrobium sp. 3C]
MGAAGADLPEERLAADLSTGIYGLGAFLPPRRVAVIGASERPGSVGRAVLENLSAGPASVFPINPRHRRVLGMPAHASVTELVPAPDLAVIATPAATVPGIVEECAQAGVKAALILSAGFKETGPAGKLLEERIVATARAKGLRVIGPNCLGLMLPHAGFNATFASKMALPGSIAFLSQSGAVGTAILDWSLREKIGFSSFFTLGSMADVDWGDILFFLAEDPKTRSIVLYMESIGDPASFLSAARAIGSQKPVVVLKVGRTKEAARAALSHTGSLAGSDEALEAAFQRVGVIRAETVEELFSLAEALGGNARPAGPRLSILTNAGGAGVLATDALLLSGGELAPLSEETRQELDRILPPSWSHNNPVDLLGDADADRYRKAAELLKKEPQSDGMLVLLCPQAMTEPTRTAERLCEAVKDYRKPVLAAWMGGEAVEEGIAVFHRAGIPCFSYPEAPARAFALIWQQQRNLELLYETPRLLVDPETLGSAVVRCEELLNRADQEDRVLLDEWESKEILRAFGIPVVPTRQATTEEEAVAAAQALGFPVAVKLRSHKLTHKSDVGGVRLGIEEEEAVRIAFREIRAAAVAHAGADAFLGVTVQTMVAERGIELILGSAADAQLGPLLVFGAGGIFVDLLEDRAMGLPPLNTTSARRMIERTRIARALCGMRGIPPVDQKVLEEILIRFGALVLALPRIREIDINPLLASGDARVRALDARMVLSPRGTLAQELPRPAIRPYPVEQIETVRLGDETFLRLRPIRGEDEPQMIAFHRELSEETVFSRYFEHLKLEQRVAHGRLARICMADYNIETVLVAEVLPPHPEAARIVAVGRLEKLHGFSGAEFALLVSDRWQQKGIGRLLLERLTAIGGREGLGWIVGRIRPENERMKRICLGLGYRIRFHEEMGENEAILSLRAPPVGRTPEHREGE